MSLCTQPCRQDTKKSSTYDTVNSTASALHLSIMHTYHRQKIHFQIAYEKIAFPIFFSSMRKQHSEKTTSKFPGNKNNELIKLSLKTQGEKK